ncbi:hypothetical protein F1737_03830 [Methanoplanus sp. FWC-SCC4]|uniref:SWIM-type domain-containing protein n=1 Tax=Methanochimaera problematica TaxID=2609417 RepID=A0AA97FCA4_9EURY|nr:SWIM zinc finger family protein [Methanoplanus sp. FWC-SCC4]WOF15887.1 hypothetical protein F1737_03830 [Methanoplanus sp. FWC-SCC4]
MDDLWKKLNISGRLTPALRSEIIDIYGKKGEKALYAVENKKIYKYLDFYVVAGKTGEYVVENNFCTCYDFSYRQVECWHILAVKIAKLTGFFIKIPKWYQDRWAAGSTDE